MNLDLDRRHIWHPYAGMSSPPPVSAAARSDGAYVTLEDGTRLVDGISSWWCAAHGHRPASVVPSCAAYAALSPV